MKKQLDDTAIIKNLVDELNKRHPEGFTRQEIEDLERMFLEALRGPLRGHDA